MTDSARIAKLNLSSEDFKEVMIFYIEFLINNLLIPGQVENFIQIINLGNKGSLKLSGIIKDAMINLSNHYKARTFKAFVVNPPPGITMLYNIFKPFLNEDQKSKTTFDEGN